MDKADSINAERVRIQAVYEHRDMNLAEDIYAPWQPGEALMTMERKRVAASMLYQLGRFPTRGSRCLEIGYGKIGWLADLLSWGLNEDDLFGIELDPKRGEKAQQALPSAHLEIGDASEMPWNDEYFNYSVVSTVFSSILDRSVRETVAHQIARVLAPGGVVVVYDLTVNNPRNKDVAALTRQELRELFPGFDYHFRSLTLVPPIARRVARGNWTMAVLLSAIPILRTHVMAVMVKK